jgi:autotransporter-associated beta strand protein
VAKARLVSTVEAISRVILLLAVFVLLSPTALNAADGTWEGGDNGKWSKNKNWAGKNVPNGEDDVATFVDVAGGDDFTPTLDKNQTVGTLSINSTQNFNISGGKELKMKVSAGSAAITVSGTGAMTLDVKLRMEDDLTITQDSSSTFTISNTIQANNAASDVLTFAGTGTTDVGATISDGSATLGLVKNGSGTLRLTAANSNTGGLTLSAGTLQLGDDNAHGTGALTFAGGTVEGYNAARSISESVSVTGNFTTGGSQDLTFSGATDLGGSTRTITVSNSGATEFSGVISNGGLTKDGSSTLKLSGANTFTSDLTINAGTLQISGSSERISNSASVVIGSSGTFDLNNFDETISGLTMTSGSVTTGTGKLILGGNVTTVGSSAEATITGLLDLGGSTRTFDIANGTVGADLRINAVISNGGITKTGDGKLTLEGSNTFGSGLTVNAGEVNLNHLNAGGSGTLTVNNGSLVRVRFSDPSTSSSIDTIVLNEAHLLRNLSSANPTTLLANSASRTLTVNGDSTIENSQTTVGGSLEILGPVSINNSGTTLTLNSSSANGEIVLGGTQSIVLAAGTELATTGASGLVTIGDTSGRTIQGNGTGSSESTVTLGAATTTFHSSTIFQVNGSGSGGLKVSGTGDKVKASITSSVISNLTGSGGTFTYDHTSAPASAQVIDYDPTAGTSVKLGISGSSANFELGASGVDDGLSNWGGLVMNGGSVKVASNQEFIGSGSGTSTFQMNGGTLNLNVKELAFGSDITLSGGTIQGDFPPFGLAGQLTTTGDLIVDGVGSTLSFSPGLKFGTGNGAIRGINGATGTTGWGQLTVSVGVSNTLSVDLPFGNNNGIFLESGTFLLGGDNYLTGGANINFTSSATFSTGGFSNSGLGKLGMSANAIIDLSTGTSVINFTDSSPEPWSTHEVRIKNWSGNIGGNGTDQLIFGTDNNALTTAQVQNIVFEDPFGPGSGDFPARILPDGEVVPVPEPSTVIGIIGLLGAIGYRERKRLKDLFMANC